MKKAWQSLLASGGHLPRILLFVLTVMGFMRRWSTDFSLSWPETMEGTIEGKTHHEGAPRSQLVSRMGHRAVPFCISLGFSMALWLDLQDY